MAEFIGPYITDLVAILGKYTPAMLDEPFASYGKAFTGVVENFPAVWVLPVRTQISDEGSLESQAHTVTIKFGVTGSEPDQVEEAAVVYMRAIHRAIAAAQVEDWTVCPLHVHAYEHDYGPLFEARGVLAKFPELHLTIEVEEL